MSTPQTVLFATDFSDCSRFAFELAEYFSRQRAGKLIVLHVSQPSGPMVVYGEAIAACSAGPQRQQLWHMLRSFKTADPAVEVQYRLVEGNPVSEILRVAATEGCDLIVLGSHGRSGLSRLLLGSVAEHVMRKAHCPVLTVKLPAKKPASREQSADTLEPVSAS